MPYINKHLRKKLDPYIEDLIEELIGTEVLHAANIEGSLNYAITRLLRGIYSLSYKDINNAMGVLESVKQEHYRRVAAPYEDIKIEENGDL